MQFQYGTVEQMCKSKFLISQTDVVLVNAPTVATGVGGFPKQIIVGGFDLLNRSGFALTVGLAGRLPISLWKAGQVTTGNVFTDDTTNAQSNNNNAFNLGTDGQVNSGIILLCRVPFNVISVVTTTQATATTTFDIAYTAAAGVWTTIANSLIAPDWQQVAGEQLATWPMPGSDWVVGVAGHATNYPVDAPGWYGIRIRELANNTAAGKAMVVVMGVSRYGITGLADKATESVNPALGELEIPPQCDALAAFFSTAADGNRVTARVRFRG
jgi:hypothetical protein